ncbi:hypothetical protein HPB52_013987 [Rhipicephalus sanguineus]|uniref:Cuticle protein n=1 Tax=Rhipicephalus sanguineus TaxID=34632 RepID=A0A9D4Q139_RHISA|nr:hypothetical protein HPB52_013987 [Rhipicephalus sanguineus]
MFAEAVFVALCLAGVASAGAVHPAPSPLYAPAPVLAAPARAVVAPLAPVAAAPVTAQSYSFGYNSADEFGTRVQRQETSDINNVRTGSYGYCRRQGHLPPRPAAPVAAPAPVVAAAPYKAAAPYAAYAVKPAPAPAALYAPAQPKYAAPAPAFAPTRAVAYGPKYL